MVVIVALGHALNPDGTIDFDTLRARGSVMTLEELCPECYDEIEVKADDPA